MAAEADGGALRTESRVARIGASHSYGFVLVLVLSSLFFTGLVPDGPWAQGGLVLLLATLLVVALWTSGVARLRSYLVTVLALLVSALGRQREARSE